MLQRILGFATRSGSITLHIITIITIWLPLNIEALFVTPIGVNFSGTLAALIKCVSPVLAGIQGKPVAHPVSHLS